MITSDEINTKATQLGINSSDVERDYVFGWILSALYSISSLKDILILKGGNVYRKGYFPRARFSSDLDFTTSQGIDDTFLLSEFNRICVYVEQKTGIHFDQNRNRIADEHIISNDKKVYKLQLYFKDFYGNESKMIISIRLDVTEFDKIYLPTQKRLLIHQYSDASECLQEIVCIKLEEALADKLKCLLQRRSSFDLFDLVYSVFVNNEIEISKKEIVSTFLKKTIFEPSPNVAKNLLFGVPYDLLRNYWNNNIICPLEARIDFDNAITLLKSGLDSLFADFSYAYVDEDSYYPSEYRNKIFEAGSSLTLLKLKYHGFERLIEPYSLTFKRRQDGVGQEYFYAYDQTGGNKGPGIKAFLNKDIETLDNTDVKFVPQYTVDIAKAGEINNKSYFSTGFRTGGAFKIRKARKPRVPSNGLIYTIQCSYCGKRFKRSKYSTRIGKHKNTYGGMCYGRVGYQVF